MPRFTDRKCKLEDFHPLLAKENQGNISELVKWTNEVKDLMPASLSPEEIQRRWEKVRDGLRQ